MMRIIFATLSLLVLISPMAGHAGETTTGEIEVTDCRFESDVRAKADMDEQDSTTKGSKDDKKAVNGT